jgi:nucleoside-diphosphate-sugar epimerase
MNKVLVTGANGFVGLRLCKKLTERKYEVCAALRQICHQENLDSQEQVIVGNIGLYTRWEAALQDVDCVIHLASRVHIMKETAVDPSAEYRRINVNGTLNLANQAAQAGVRRFIFISSIKVNGEFTLLGVPFTEQDIPSPLDPYGKSKYETEKMLRDLTGRTDMELVIIRPVLIYGPGVKANFFSMMNWLYKGIPVPFGAIHNQRSFAALDNVVDLIITCIDHSSAANQIFLVSDGEDMSTTKLLKRMANALEVPVRLVRVPSWLFIFLGRTNPITRRLFGSLQVDISKASKLLNWTPPISVDEALRDTAQYFLKQFPK